MIVASWAENDSFFIQNYWRGQSISKFEQIITDNNPRECVLSVPKSVQTFTSIYVILNDDRRRRKTQPKKMKKKMKKKTKKTLIQRGTPKAEDKI
jgi:DNA primase catalytic subunit